MKGYVKDGDGRVLYKVDIPDLDDTLILNDREEFVAEDDLDNIDTVDEIEPATMDETELFIAEKIRQIAIQGLLDEGKITEEKANLLLEKTENKALKV